MRSQPFFDTFFNDAELDAIRLMLHHSSFAKEDFNDRRYLPWKHLYSERKVQLIIVVSSIFNVLVKSRFDDETASEV